MEFGPAPTLELTQTNRVVRPGADNEARSSCNELSKS